MTENIYRGTNGDEFDPSLLDPGVRELVVWLRSLGFNTSDSGDGKSKFEAGLTVEDGVLPFPHVNIDLSKEEESLEKQCDRLYALLAERIGESDGQHDWQVEGFYLAGYKSKSIMITNVNDDRLNGKGSPGDWFNPEECGCRVDSGDGILIDGKTREQVVAACEDDMIDSCRADSGFMASVIRGGFQGFKNMNDKELVQAYTDAGLDDRG